jgi:hypothetical protein
MVEVAKLQKMTSEKYYKKDCFENVFFCTVGNIQYKDVYCK